MAKKGTEDYISNIFSEMEATINAQRYGCSSAKAEASEILLEPGL